MADFQVNLSTLSNNLDDFNSISKKIQRINEEYNDIVSSLRTSVSEKVSNKTYIRKSLSDCKNDAKALRKVLDKAYKEYLKTEKILTGIGDPTKIKPKDVHKYDGYKYSDSDKKIKKDKKTIYKNKEDVNLYDQKDAIFESTFSKDYEKSLLSGEASVEGEAGHLDAEVKVGTFEAHGSISGGFYVFERDENGNLIKKIAPALAAEVGVSVTALSAAVDGRLGLGENNNMLGVYGNGEVVVGKAAAEGKLSASVFDSDGNLNPQFQGKVSAEAVLVEAKGTAGISVLGTDVGVTGSVNIGVGAHADVGFVDGKLKVDIGASLGIGVSVGFEVDVGGTVDAVKAGAKSIFKSIFG